jgi:hypothetical protein
VDRNDSERDKLRDERDLLTATNPGDLADAWTMIEGLPA